ncbi:MAG TPA: hypothetical protein VK968_15105, partial [Roseimicrobium sp.]|nr:hypothetical protein [Roseimicrobium sp.]
MSDEIPKLRLAVDAPAFEAPMNLEREKQTIHQVREEDLEDSLAPFRVGSVPYLNSVPLTRGLEKEICFLPPSQLAGLLR